MKLKKNTTNYWFTIEPYVYVNISNRCALLYNTLDGVTLESDKVDVIELLQKTLHKENCGVVLLTSDRLKNKDIFNFINELRENFMGDIIDVALSKGKPVQLLPYFNFLDKHEAYKKHENSPAKNIMEYLSEIKIHVDSTTSINNLIPFLQSLTGKPAFRIIGNIWDVDNYPELLSFFEQHVSVKYILCSYTHIFPIQPKFNNNFSYIIHVNFPIDVQLWNSSRRILLNQTFPYEYIFEILSTEDYQQAERLVELFLIKKYQMQPVYTGNNINFFKQNVFLYKEDNLSASISIKDLFIRQSINLYDFGKINIMPNGDAYANVNYPVLGNIHTHSISEIVYKEIEEGKSWFRIRDQAPCNNCIYQWLCPSPSNYEIAIGRPNLCHVKKND